MERIAEGFTAEIFRWGQGRALKLYRPPFAAVAQREYEIMQRLAGSGLRIPRVIETVQVEGRSGYVMEEIRGPSFRDLLETDPDAGPQFATELGKLHARVHACPTPPAPFDSIRLRVTEKIQATDNLDGLREPVDAALDSIADGEMLCHNDFHFGNVLQDENNLWMVDWNGAGRGDRHADIAKSTVLMSEAPAGICFGPRAHERRSELTQIYRDAYNAERELDTDLLRQWQIVRAAELISLGVPFSGELRSLIESLL